MSTQHHASEDLLWDYHRGALAPGMRLTVTAHLELCDHCRSDLRLFDAIGGALLADIDDVAMSDNALDLALARIERPDDAVPAATVKHPAFLEGFELPESVKAAVIEGRYWAAPGVWMAPIAVDGAPKGSKTYLMHVKAGMVMPEHTHRGLEMTVVLKGRFSDAFGDYGVGDFTACDDAHSHSPTIADGDDCLCLISQAAAIVPKTLLGKVLQPFARI